jgi:L-cystine transport system substrate-binding protein
MSPHEVSPAVEMIRAFHPVDVLETLEPGVLRVACTGEPPTDYVEDGQIMGIHGEVRRRVADILALDAQPVQMNFPDMIPALEAGEIDLPGIGTAWTEHRARSFQMTQPFQYFFFGVAVRDGPATVPLPSVAGRRISTLTGSFNNDEVAAAVAEHGGSVTLHDELGGVLSDLESGAGEVAIYDHPNIAMAIAERETLSGFTVKRLTFDRRYPLTTGRVACRLVMRGEARRLAEGARLAIDLLRSTGELVRIYERHGAGEELLGLDPT